jgi:hypothetical protein
MNKTGSELRPWSVDPGRITTKAERQPRSPLDAEMLTQNLRVLSQFRGGAFEYDATLD